MRRLFIIYHLRTVSVATVVLTAQVGLVWAVYRGLDNLLKLNDRTASLLSESRDQVEVEHTGSGGQAASRSE